MRLPINEQHLNWSYFAPLQRHFPYTPSFKALAYLSNFWINLTPQKPESVGYPPPPDPSLSRFDIIPTRDRRTDGRTVRLSFQRQRAQRTECCKIDSLLCNIQSGL